MTLENVEYIVVQSPSEEWLAVRLLRPEYENIVYQYGKVTLDEDEGCLNFERTFRYVPEEFDVEDLEMDEELQNLMGDILCELIANEIESEK